MTYSISCVLLIQAAHRGAINDLAESLGYGPDNMSVPLITPEGAEWFGSHAWCSQAFLDQIADPAYACPALSALVVSAITDGDPASNWAQALTDNGLLPVTPIGL